jgi:hypothetical protein
MQTSKTAFGIILAACQVICSPTRNFKLRFDYKNFFSANLFCSLLLCFFITFYFSSTFNDDERSLTTNDPQRRMLGKSPLLSILIRIVCPD